MQKKLIALAIAGLSTAAFAQSNVTISGNFDTGYYHQSMQTAGLADTTSYAASNGSSTTTLGVLASENLGNGMTAGFQGNTDFGGSTITGSALFNSQNFLFLSGNFGTVRAGLVNTAALGATMAAQPFGTGIGSGISGAFGRLSLAGINGIGAANGTAGVALDGEQAGTGIAGARSVRVNNSLMYVSPTFSGFSGSLQLAAKNNDASVAAAGNNAGFTALGLAYANGPINVQYVNEQHSMGSVAGTGAMGAQIAANEKVTHNILAGNYTFGPATVYAGWTSSKSNTAARADARSWNIALKYQITPALSAAANIIKVDDKLATDADRNLNALGLDYAMSKRTTAYARWESGDNDRSSATGNNVGGFSRYQLGMRHSF